MPPVAGKTLSADQAAHPRGRERFRRETDAVRRIGGFWTASVVDADPDATIPWVATAYLGAPDLAEHVRGRGPLPAAALLVLARGLAEALAAIHVAGLTHRDLKRANVLTTDDGPRIIDFGIARADTDATLTTVGAVLGTPVYIAPEQANGARIGPFGDVFSLGAPFTTPPSAPARSDMAPYPQSCTGWCTTLPTSPPSLGGRPPTLDAPELAEYVRRRGPFPAAVLLLLARGLAEALAASTTPAVLAACLHKEAVRRPTAVGLLTLLAGPSTALAEGEEPGEPGPAPVPATARW